MKGSYEYATRLPQSDELFGDGATVYQNLELRPEASHNVNLGVLLETPIGAAGELSCEVTGFLRSTQNMILELLMSNLRDTHFVNVFAVRTLGTDGVLRWVAPGELFTLQQNLTFQDQRNVSTRGRYAPSRGERVPNRPYFFANSSAQLRLAGVGAPNAVLTLGWNLRYVRSFLMGWEGTADLDSERIPDQLSQDVSVSYALEGPLKLAFTIDVTNLTDAHIEDVLGVQNPGRAAFFKVSVQWEPTRKAT